MNRPPFDLTEAEQELVGGYQTEYSSTRFAMYYLAEFLATVVMSTIIVTPSSVARACLFIVGDPERHRGLLVLASCCFLFHRRARREGRWRYRYDQLMDLGWKLLIPVAFGWMLLDRIAEGRPGRGLGRCWSLAIALVVAAVAAAVFMLALRVSAHNRQLEGELF